MNFLRGLFRGLIITLLGTTAVYVIFFAVMAPKLPKDAAGMKEFFSDLVNVKSTFSRMQNKSVDYLEKKDVKDALEADSLPQGTAVITDADPELVTREEFEQLKREVEQLKKHRHLGN